MTRWVAGCLLALAGCSETQSFHGDVAFTAEERAAIERGNAFISEHTGRDPFDIVWDASDTSDTGNGPTIVRGVSGPWDGHGWISGIEVVETTDFDRLAAIAAHEFGHQRGLGHHTGPGVMSHDAAIGIVWTTEDRAACVRDHVCK